MKVLITGATGFLGGRIVMALVHASHDVRALVRKTSNVDDIPRQVELAYGDVRDLQSLIAAFEGCDAVIHVGAMVSSWSPTPSLYYQVNVEGLKNVIEAMKHALTVKKLIYTSSYFAVGPTGDQPVDESKEHFVFEETRAYGGMCLTSKNMFGSCTQEWVSRQSMRSPNIWPTLLPEMQPRKVYL